VSSWVGDNAWLAWLAVAIVLGIVEVTTLDLVFIMLAAGAVGGALVSLVGAGLVLQVLVALITAVAMLGVVRPVALRHLHQPHATRTGVAALVGAKAVVLERVDSQTGRVRLGGEVWSARAYDPGSVIEAGCTVDVAQIEGATAVVYESEL